MGVILREEDFVLLSETKKDAEGVAEKGSLVSLPPRKNVAYLTPLMTTLLKHEILTSGREVQFPPNSRMEVDFFKTILGRIWHALMPRHWTGQV